MTPLEYHEVVRVEAALRVARFAVRALHPRTWRGYVDLLAHALDLEFEEQSGHRGEFAPKIELSPWLAAEFEP